MQYRITHHRCPEFINFIVPGVLTAWTDVLEENDGSENKT